MRAQSIRVRLTVLYSLVLALSLCVFGVVAHLAMSHSIRSTMDAGLRQKLEGVRAIIAEDAPSGRAVLNDELSELAASEGSDGRVLVMNASGETIFASPGMDFMRGCKAGHPNGATFDAIVAKGHSRVLCETIEVGGKSYDVAIASSAAAFDRAFDRFRLVLYLAAPVFLALAALGGLWMSHRALAPVDEITQAARGISAQNLSERLAVPTTGDELERLGNTLNEMFARLERAFKQVTQFTADASHELRTPVSVMRTTAEVALRKPRSEPEYREALAHVLQEAERLSELIEQLLVLARADTGPVALPMQPTNLVDTIHHACQQARVLAESRHLTLEEHLPDRSLWVQGEASSLERLFLVLLDNAVKYTPGGGRIEVQLSRKDGFAVADVRDTGIGIAAEDLPHVFDRFYRADRARTRESGGAGLGLAIGRWIASAHGGEIRVESEPSRGSSFQVRLPLFEA